MRTNAPTRQTRHYTHEGGRAMPQKPLDELTRAVATCMLWENTFYETGDEIANRIVGLCDQVDIEDVGAIAITARNDWKLRHIPLWLACQAVRINSQQKRGSNVPEETIFEVVQRPDELGELLSLYWRLNGRPPRTHTEPKKIPHALRRGLATAFTRFNAYQLAKWDRDAEVRLRDVLFLCHAKPENEEQAELWRQLVDGTLPVPDTWEVALSAGKDKKAIWERLIGEKKLGYMALLQNLRNMDQAGVDYDLVSQALVEGAYRSRALPFRFVTAVRFAPRYAKPLSEAMCRAVRGHLKGETVVVVDVSASMNSSLSERSDENGRIKRLKRGSDTKRVDAASALAVLLNEVTPCRIFTFSNEMVEVPAHPGLGLIREIDESQLHGGTRLGGALGALRHAGIAGQRMIVITDEQAHDFLPVAWMEHSYLINVAGYKPALDTTQGWMRINGFSERIVDWIAYEEQGKLLEATDG